MSTSKIKTVSLILLIIAFLSVIVSGIIIIDKVIDKKYSVKTERVVEE